MDWEVTIGILTGVLTAVPIVWKKVIKPVANVFKQHEDIVQSITIIKNQIVSPDGEPLKDSVKYLKDTCKNIEKNQKILEQRSRSSLHYSDQALFETDRDGQLIWTNDAFYRLTGMSLSKITGYDWISLIKESEREDFLKEFASCVNMGRKLDIDTVSVNDKSIKMVGHPFKYSDTEHGGFLIHYYEEENKDEQSTNVSKG